MATPLSASFGRWLRLRRKVLDLTQEALAQAAGCSTVTIRKLEADERRPSRQIAERLADVLQIAPHERAAFIGLARAEPSDDPAPVSAPALPPARQPRTLPAPLTRLLGRKRELAALRNTLLRGDTRLLTLTGLPGVGKSRLALQAAAELRPAFADAVCFVPLAPVQQPDLVLSALAQALAIRPSGGRPLAETVAAYLQHKHMLLLLDNFEQLLDAAPLLVALLEQAPGLKALVTSRAALRVRGERVVQLAPLPTPASGAAMTVRAAAQNPAVALFVERARAAAPDFALSDATAPLVAELCSRLEGLPLAIELVAARADQLALPELLAGLDRRLELLGDGPRDLPPRHRTLRAAIAESYALLGPEAQALFRRLGVFVGGWTVAAAGAVWSPPAVGTPLPALLAALTSHSLIGQHGGPETGPRYAMLETIRAYALEQLAATGEETAARDAQLRYFGALVAQARPELHGPHQLAWLDTLALEHPNLRAALEWSLQANDPNQALRLAGGLGWFWFVRGHSAEGRHWLDRTIAASASTGEPETEALAGALLAAGHLALFAGDFAEARRQLETSASRWRELHAARPADATGRHGLVSTLAYLVIAAQYQGDGAAREAFVAEYLALYEGLDDPRLRALFHFNAGRAALLQFGDHATARTQLERSLELLSAQGDLWTMAQVVIDLGLVALAGGDVAQAQARYEQGRTLAERLGDRTLLALALNNLGEAARIAGAFDAAAAHYSASLQLHQEQGDSAEAPRLLHNLGYVALRRGEPARAADYFRESLRGFVQVGMGRGIAEALAGFAALAADEGRASEAAGLWAAAEALRAREQTPIWPADQREYAHYQARARAQLTPEQWRAAWDEGTTQPPPLATLLGG